MKKQRGFSLIGVLIIIGALILTAGGMVALPTVRQVWERKVAPKPNPELTPPAREITVTPPPSKVGSEEYTVTNSVMIIAH